MVVCHLHIVYRGILYKTPLSNVYINVQIEVYYFQTDLYLYVNVNGVLYKIPLVLSVTFQHALSILINTAFMTLE